MPEYFSTIDLAASLWTTYWDTALPVNCCRTFIQRIVFWKVARFTPRILQQVRQHTWVKLLSATRAKAFWTSIRKSCDLIPRLCSVSRDRLSFAGLNWSCRESGPWTSSATFDCFSIDFMHPTRNQIGWDSVGQNRCALYICCTIWAGIAPASRRNPPDPTANPFLECLSSPRRTWQFRP